MKFFAYLTVLFCLGVHAIPKEDGEQTPDVGFQASTFEAVPAAGVPARAVTHDQIIEKREHITTTIEKHLSPLGLTLDSSIHKLLKKLGLKAADDDIDALLLGLVGKTDGVLNKVDNIVGDLLGDLGLGGLDLTIKDAEKGLGLKGRNTIRKLLRSLHLL